MTIMNTQRLFIAGACALTLGLESAQASLILAKYNFDTNSAAATNVASVVNVGDWVANAGTISSGSAFIAASDTPSSIDPATDTSYHSFSFTVQNLEVGELLNMTSVGGDFFGSIHTGTGGNAGHRIELYSDQVGFSDTDDRLGEQIWIDNNPATSRPSSTSFEISTLAIGSLSNGDNVEFRFYFSDSSSNAGRNSRLDNIVLNGAVVPEPGTFVLSGGGLALVWMMRRRRRSGQRTEKQGAQI